MDRADAAPDGRRDLRARPGARLEPSSGRRPRHVRRTQPEPRVRRHAPATSATRHPARSRSGKGGRTATTRSPAGCRRTTGPAATCRSTGCPASSTRAEGFIVTANQAVTGPDYPYYLSDSLGLRLPQPADPRPADRERIHDGSAASRRRHGADPARHPQPDGARCSCRTCCASC